MSRSESEWLDFACGWSLAGMGVENLWRQHHARLWKPGGTLSSGNEKTLKDFIRGRTGSDLCFRKITRQCGRSQLKGQKVSLTADGLVRDLTASWAIVASGDDEVS